MDRYMYAISAVSVSKDGKIINNKLSNGIQDKQGIIKSLKDFEKHYKKDCLNDIVLLIFNISEIDNAKNSNQFNSSYQREKLSLCIDRLIDEIKQII